LFKIILKEEIFKFLIPKLNEIIEYIYNGLHNLKKIIKNFKKLVQFYKNLLKSEGVIN